jgi:hypothetical protein
MSVYPEGELCSDLGNMLVFNAPTARRARRTVGKAREFLKKGNIAEAEALCLEQMEHMHARQGLTDNARHIT